MSRHRFRAALVAAAVIVVAIPAFAYPAQQQQNISEFESLFNGTHPFTSDVVIGTPDASFAEEVETMITFPGGQIDLDTLYHESKHQWGDNVTETEPQLETAFHQWLPNQSAACGARLTQFFHEWFDTAYAAGGGANRPQITGPGLSRPGFSNAAGGCA